jgi:deoxyribose-phosphate aldolase
MRAEDLSKTLDHTVLAADTRPEDVERACDDARSYHVAALCSYPRFVPVIAERLRGGDVKTCAAIGFPLGADPTVEKVRAAEVAVADGAAELAVVLNVPALMAGEFKRVRDDLALLVRTVRARAANSARGDVLLKVVIEAPMLDERFVRLACKIVDDVRADFAVTCTGVGHGVASTEDVEVMRDALPEYVGVAAAGGITTLADVQAMISAGAARVSTPNACAVLDELLAASGDGSSR